jgi:hypothetical protein
MKTQTLYHFLTLGRFEECSEKKAITLMDNIYGKRDIPRLSYLSNSSDFDSNGLEMLQQDYLYEHFPDVMLSAMKDGIYRIEVAYTGPLIPLEKFNSLHQFDEPQVYVESDDADYLGHSSLYVAHREITVLNWVKVHHHHGEGWKEIKMYGLPQEPATEKL